MTPALWGVMTALGWGTADFIARFTGRGLGHATALFGMLAFSLVIMSGLVWALEVPLVWRQEGWWLLLLTGLGIMAATLFLYWALTRGPIAVAAPIASAYPALNLFYAVALGGRPSALDWVALATVLLGVFVVARAGEAGAEESMPPAEVRKTALIALGACLIFAVTVSAAQAAGEIYGEMQTVWIARWIALFGCAIFLTARRLPLKLPRRWWPLLLLQGVLDGSAYLTLVAAGAGTGGAIAIAVASTFCAVTVILARIVLKEAVTWRQWGGVVMIVCGVAVLSAELEGMYD